MSTVRMKFIFWAVSAVCVIAAGYALSYSSAAGAAMIAVVLLFIPFGLWYLRDHRVGLALVILSIIPGNLIRLSLGTDVRGGAAILISDLVIPLLAAVWFLRKMVVDKKFVRTPVNAPFLVFTIVALISYVQGIFIVQSLGTPDLKELVVSFLYWGRWVEYGLLFFIATDIIKTEQDSRFFLRLLIVTAVIIAIGGFFQLIFYPDFTQYAIQAGWDPHQDRLLSSFFDPNFVGGFFALVLSVLMGLFFYTPETRKKALLCIPAVILGVALVLTFSRSGYLALIVAGTVIGMLRSRATLFFGIVLFAITLLLVPRALTRVTEGLSVDETGVKRIESWTKAVSIVPQYPLLGTGYNMFAIVQRELGTADEFDVNNRSGVENSFLTVLVTTGIVGFAAFTYLYVVILRSLYRNWKDEALPGRTRGINLGVFAGVLGLLFHSIFIHSLMYPFILIYFWILIAIALRQSNATEH